MADAREVLDRLTAAMEAKDLDALAACYAPDARAITPDAGEIVGAEAIRDYLGEFWKAFPDVRYEHIRKHGMGAIAIDEGYVVGTHNGPLTQPNGETVSPTGRVVRVRSCDVAEVQGDKITTHRMYFDQLDFLAQLGMVPEMASRSH